jgi:hypothetical protein
MKIFFTDQWPLSLGKGFAGTFGKSESKNEAANFFLCPVSLGEKLLGYCQCAATAAATTVRLVTATRQVTSSIVYLTMDADGMSRRYTHTRYDNAYTQTPIVTTACVVNTRRCYTLKY